MKKLAVLSLSGGMDSTSLLVHLLAHGYEVHALSFEYGQKHVIEIDMARQNVLYMNRVFTMKNPSSPTIKHQVINLKFLGQIVNSALTNPNIEVPEGHYEEENMKVTVVPNRNAIFSSIIYSLALSLANEYNTEVKICLGIHSGDHAIYPDCTQEFRDKIEEVFKIGNWGGDRVTYYTPFINGNKTTILQECLENCEKLGLNFDKVLSSTITSYNPDNLGHSSGKSGSDIERIEAFLNIGRKDPIKYQQPWEEIVKHAKKLLNRE